MIYTKTGDKGTTSLVGGSRVKKCDPRVEAYGTVDELNAHIGLLGEYIRPLDSSADNPGNKHFNHLTNQLKSIQNNLFVIQTLLATEDKDTYTKLPQLKEEAVAEIEQWIDSTEKELPRLKSFVIPGGSVASAEAHVARTVCRRAERRCVLLMEHNPVEENIMKYLNRLSDYLFVTSRFILHMENKEEIFWSAE
ncbi:MAG: cob(I)yrinic acid a,c-diamide adenosyltransferase [Bacteroidales bacterium]|jgi:cob(I)alamin adenosyltransferase|nr:cob(I)yrinic acid a,c-diamide adenosyltransferase [Bacteroidales bacterium]